MCCFVSRCLEIFLLPVSNFSFDSIMVRECTWCDFNSLKVVEVCFMVGIQSISIYVLWTLEENTHSAVVGRSVL